MITFPLRQKEYCMREDEIHVYFCQSRIDLSTLSIMRWIVFGNHTNWIVSRGMPQMNHILWLSIYNTYILKYGTFVDTFG